jgi:hypothetical protein
MFASGVVAVRPSLPASNFWSGKSGQQQRAIEYHAYILHF